MLGVPSGQVPASLLAEGRAMLSALAADFAALDGVDLLLVQDTRLAIALPPRATTRLVSDVVEERKVFASLARQADATLVVAPELNNQLATRCQMVLEAGGRLLGPSLGVVRLASDKQVTAEHLRSRGIPVPEGRPLEPDEPIPAGFPRPAVVKPRFGAGSCGVALLGSGGDVAGHDTLGRQRASKSSESSDPARLTHDELPGRRRLERYVPGLAVSVALICGPNTCVALPPCAQRLGAPGGFTYLGGRLPLEPELVQRAIGLGSRVVAALPERLGYVGIDMVLAEDRAALGPMVANGKQAVAAEHDRHAASGGDVVIEVNPRITTSYVGLRAAVSPGVNLAETMLGAWLGGVPEVRFDPYPVAFCSDGRVQCRK